MGGQALKSAPTKRLLKTDYEQVSAHVQSALREKFGARAEIIVAYRDKEDFGDCDVLVEREKVLPNEGNILGMQQDEAFASVFEFTQQMNAREVVVNDNIVSFDYRSSPNDPVGFQVDLIITPRDEIDVALNFFSYNDLGNLIGRVAHKMGCSYGHRGLIYPMRDKDHIIAMIELSRDPDQMLAFLGYDAKRYHQGFNNLEEIFDFVCSGEFFNPDIFLLENRNNKSRTRDKKRPTYQKFLKYLETLENPKRTDFPEDKSVWLPRMFSFFPNAQQKIDQALAEEKVKNDFRGVFNGEIFTEKTGVVGKDLGILMSKVRREMEQSRPDWREHAIENPSWVFQKLNQLMATDQEIMTMLSHKKSPIGLKI